MAGISPVDYLVLNVRHRTNEDWVLELPLGFQADELDGATVVCQLKSPDGKLIELECSIVEQKILTQLDRRQFENKQGKYTGDVLLTLSGDRDMVTHILNLELTKGISSHG